MFRTHDEHLQSSFFDAFIQLSASRQQRLEVSWAGAFYQDVFCRIDETLFAPLYSEEPSRPNTPVNQLIGIEILKAGHNWSDEELLDHLHFDLQVRYALGVRDLEDEICTLRTIYNFRRRVSEHMQATGENLFAQVFAQVTDEQCQDLGLDTRRQRMDSTQIGSNIRQYSRLRLLIEVLLRATRMLTKTDHARYAEVLQPYLQGNAGQYCYRVRPGSYAEHLEQVGQVIAQLLEAWASDYATEPAYALLQRVFHEHFTITDPSSPQEITVKSPQDLAADTLQSPDDPEATYRQKQGQGYRGYVANVTETCDPDNDMQLITHLQVETNQTDDQTMLVDAIPDIQARMPLTDLDIDGGYTGPEATRTSTASDVTLHPTAIRGAQPDPDQVGLAEFTWEQEDELPTRVTCPQGQTVDVQPGKADHRYLAYFDAAVCADCPLRDQCPSRPLKRRSVRVLRVSRRQIEVAQLRQAVAATQQTGPPYLRPAVEATVRSLKHPFGDERNQLPVRGKARIAMTIIASGFMVNLRRIWRYQLAKSEVIEKNSDPAPLISDQDSFLSRCQTALLGLHQRLRCFISRYDAGYCC